MIMSAMLRGLFGGKKWFFDNKLFNSSKFGLLYLI